MPYFNFHSYFVRLSHGFCSFAVLYALLYFKTGNHQNIELQTLCPKSLMSQVTYVLNIVDDMYQKQDTK